MKTKNHISTYKLGSDDYLIEMCDYTINLLVREKEHLYKAYDYYNGKRTISLFEHLEKNYGIGSPTSITFTPLVRKHVDAIVGEFLSTKIEPKISCKDEKTLTNIFRDKLLEISKLVRDYVSKSLENSIYLLIAGNEQLQDRKTYDEVIKRDIDNIKESVNRHFVSNYEIAGQNIVLYIMLSRKMDFMNKLHQMILDLLITGLTYYKVIPSSAKTNFKIEVYSPLNAFVDKDPKSKYVKDGYRSVVRKWMTPEEIVIKYGDNLSRKDVDSIMDYAGMHNDHHNHFLLVSGLESRCGNRNPGILDGVGAHPVNDYDENSEELEWNMIPVYECEWIDWDTDSKDHIIGVKYNVTRIGTDIYILDGEDEYLVRDVDNPNEIKLSLNGIFYTQGSGSPYSLMLATAELLDKYDLLHYIKDNQIALSGVRGAHVDIAHLPTELGADFQERLVKYMAYRKTGISLYDSSQEGDVINTTFNGFDDTLSALSIAGIIQAILLIEEETSLITGVFLERLKGAEARDAVRNVEIGMLQSYIITKLYYQIMDTLVSEILTDCLNLAKKVYKKGMTGLIILGNLKEIFTIMPEYYSFTDFDVHVADSSELIKEQDLIKQLAIQLSSSNQVDPEILVIVSTSHSLTEVRDLVMKSIAEKKIENNQIAKLNQALEEAKKTQEQLQKQLEASTKKINQLNERKMAIDEQDNKMRQSIDWYKVRSDAEYKEQEIAMMREKNKLEALQLVDDNPNNDEIDRDRY